MSAELEKLKCVEVELREKSQENIEILQLNTDLESKVVRSDKLIDLLHRHRHLSSSSFLHCILAL